MRTHEPAVDALQEAPRAVVFEGWRRIAWALRRVFVDLAVAVFVDAVARVGFDERRDRGIVGSAVGAVFDVVPVDVRVADVASAVEVEVGLVEVCDKRAVVAVVDDGIARRWYRIFGI